MEAKAVYTPSQPDQAKSRVRADFEGLLELAENTQQSLESINDRLSNLRASGQGAGLLGIIDLLAAYVGGASILLVHNGGTFFIPAHIGWIFLFAGVLMGLLTARYTHSLLDQIRFFTRTKRTYERDLAEIVELLREIEPVVAKEEELSVLKRVQIRIRLSRFGVGQSQRESPMGADKEITEDFSARKKRADQELAKPF